MIDAHYTNPRLAELYDIDSPWSEDREFYLRLAGGRPERILDLGCGTGLLCDAYAAAGHSVTGVDPAEAMLAVARRKPHGAEVNWIQSCAQDFRSEQTFDLIVMTGHAFQAVLDDADIDATFATMRKHLAPKGRVVFESRNPAIDWPSQWNYDLDLQLPNLIVRESRRMLSMVRDRMRFELNYQFPDGVLSSASELRFLRKVEIEERLSSAGLQLDSVLGDWDSKPFDERVSQEMIFTASRTP